MVVLAYSIHTNSASQTRDTCAVVGADVTRIADEIEATVAFEVVERRSANSAHATEVVARTKVDRHVTSGSGEGVGADALRLTFFIRETLALDVDTRVGVRAGVRL